MKAAQEPPEITHGLRAGLAVISARPRDVLRVSFSRASARAVEPATRPLRSRGIPCGMLPDKELDLLARVQQHEGLCVEARPRRWVTCEDVTEHLVSSRGAGLALDRVKNPYNTGAILRSAAFFGVDAMIIGAPLQHPGLDGQAVRVAEGGAEHVLLARTTHLADALGAMRKRGVLVVGTDGHARLDATTYAFARPVVLVMGHEREGLHERVRAECDALVAIRGTGKIESLNVAVAAGVLIARMARPNA